MSEKKKIRKYFPNRIKDVMSIPEEMLQEFDFDDVFNKNWELRPGKEFVVRGSRRGRPMDVEERSFSSPHHARRYMDELFSENYEITVATNHAVFMMRDISGYEMLDEQDPF